MAKKRCLLLCWWITAANTRVEAIPATRQVLTEFQPDGTKISLLLRGDETSHWMTDIQDYMVTKTSDGSYVYVEDANEESIQSSSRHNAIIHELRLVGKFQPKQFRNDAGLARHPSQLTLGRRDNCFKRICGEIPEPVTANTTTIDQNVFTRKSGNIRQLRGSNTFRHAQHLLVNDPGHFSHRRRSALPTTGTIRNLVILLQFGDHRRERRALPSISDIESHMESVKELFLENSYGKLTIESTVVPSWVTTQSSEAWYADNRSGGTNLHEALREALAYLEYNELVNFKEFDQNRDGYVDMLTVLHSGYGAEHGATDCHGTDYKDRIWTHQWELFGDSAGNNIGPFVGSDSIKVWKYQMAPVLWGLCGNSLAHVGALAHEIGHSLGLPDLSDADGSGNGIGRYDLMSDPWGFDNTQQRPSQLSAWSKMKLGWLEPRRPEIGFNWIGYAEEPSNFPQLYKIGDGAFNFPPNEYLLIEYRAKKGIDMDLPGEGLLIYHIDESDGVSNNANEGHPWQLDGFPSNGKHYMVALLQADRLYSIERGINNGGSRDFYHKGYIDALLPSKDPLEGPFPNTDRYQKGNVVQTGVQIFDISAAGHATMSFSFDTDNSYIPPNTIDANFVSWKDGTLFGSDQLISHLFKPGSFRSRSSSFLP